MLQEQEHYFLPATYYRLPFQKKNQKECHQVFKASFFRRQISIQKVKVPSCDWLKGEALVSV